jgi:hypothetical protein
MFSQINKEEEEKEVSVSCNMQHWGKMNGKTLTLKERKAASRSVSQSIKGYEKDRFKNYTCPYLIFLE